MLPGLLLSPIPFQCPLHLYLNPCPPQSWDQPGPHPHCLFRAQKAEDITASSGNWVPHGPSKTHKPSTAAVWRPCSLPLFSFQPPVCLDKPQSFDGLVFPSVTWDLPPLPRSTPLDERVQKSPRETF